MLPVELIRKVNNANQDYGGFFMAFWPLEK
jgi:hypothetical protein